MRFAFDDDQLLFRDTVRGFLAKECPPERVREAWDDAGRGVVRDLWSGLADMGVIGLLAPESAGGMGMGDLDMVLILEETGRVGLPGPFVETAALASALFAVAEQSDEVSAWSAGIADGSLVVSAAFGTSLHLDADIAGLIVGQRGDEVVAVSSDAVTLVPQPSVDGARRLFRASWEGSDEHLIRSEQGSLLGEARDRGALAASAQLIGLAERMLDMTVEYVTQREQFGVPIGSFQAVKHHLTNALLSLSFARPLVYNAAYSTAHVLDTRSRDASMAKAAASDAAREVTGCALQCHGAMGYTVEYDLHLYMKRAWALAEAWGDARLHRGRVGDSLGL